MKKFIAIPLCTFFLVFCCTLAWAQSNSFAIQVAAMSSEASAEALISGLQAQGFEAYLSKIEIPGKGLYYRVRIGYFANRAAAQRQAEQVRGRQLIDDF